MRKDKIYNQNYMLECLKKLFLKGFCYQKSMCPGPFSLFVFLSVSFHTHTNTNANIQAFEMSSQVSDCAAGRWMSGWLYKGVLSGWLYERLLS